LSKRTSVGSSVLFSPGKSIPIRHVINETVFVHEPPTPDLPGSLQDTGSETHEVVADAIIPQGETDEVNTVQFLTSSERNLRVCL